MEVDLETNKATLVHAMFLNDDEYKERNNELNLMPGKTFLGF